MGPPTIGLKNVNAQHKDIFTYSFIYIYTLQFHLNISLSDL